MGRMRKSSVSFEFDGLVKKLSESLNPTELAKNCDMDDSMIKLLDSENMVCFYCCAYFNSKNREIAPDENSCSKCKGLGFVKMTENQLVLKTFITNRLKSMESNLNMQ